VTADSKGPVSQRMVVWNLLRSDAEAIRAWDGRLAPFVFPQLFAVASYRFAHALRGHGWSRLARVVSTIGHVLTGAELDPAAEVGPGFHIRHTTGVVVGPGVRAGANLRLWGGVVLGATYWESTVNPTGGSPSVGDGVQVLTKASVIGPVMIGDRARIGAHALVLKDVPPDHVAKGVPARSDVRGDLDDVGVAPLP
jgi:serine O-acetyltransferase